MQKAQIDDTLNTLYKPINEVLKYKPGPRRWRAAHDLLWKNLSWKNQQIYNDVVEECRIYREAQGTFNPYGKSDDKNSSLRQFLNFPTGAYYAITKADPQAFMSKANAAKMFKEFKEYRMSEKY